MGWPSLYAGQILTADHLTEMQWKVVSQGSEQTVTNSTTLVDTALTFDVVAGGIYMVHLRVRWQESASGGGFRCSWSSPAGTTATRAVVAPGTTATMGPQALDVSQIRVWTLDQEMFTNAAIATSTTHAWFEDLLFNIGGDGAMTFQFAQETAAAGGTTINPASFLAWLRVG
ncbi:MAG UNVERIFIED_CONTAM: hypothetical protein LOD86_00155 [Thermobifida fusca]